MGFSKAGSATTSSGFDVPLRSMQGGLSVSRVAGRF